MGPVSNAIFPSARGQKWPPSFGDVWLPIDFVNTENHQFNSCSPVALPSTESHCRSRERYCHLGQQPDTTIRLFNMPSARRVPDRLQSAPLLPYLIDIVRLCSTGSLWTQPQFRIHPVGKHKLQSIPATLASRTTWDPEPKRSLECPPRELPLDQDLQLGA